MSVSVSATDLGTFDLLVGNTALIKRQIADFSAETSTGLISQDYAGLGAGAGSALDLQVALTGNGALQTGLTSAATIQSATQTALGQIEQIASNFANTAQTLITTPGATATVATQAGDTLTQLAGLLDTKVGDTYIFAGQDSRNPPVPNPDQIGTSAFTTAIAAAIAGLTTNGAAATEAQTLAIASPGGTSPFSATLEASSAASVADLGDGQTIKVGVLANQNADAVSSGTGTTSTGSYTRDIFRALATLASLTPAQSSDPSFALLIQSTVTSLQGATSAINTDIGALGARQQHVSATQSDLTATSTALTTQLSSIQDADLTTVATQLSQAQTQLQASYQVIAGLGSLSLAKFLPAS